MKERKEGRKEGRKEERKVGRKVFSKKKKKKKKLVRAVVADAFNPSIWEAEADRLKCSRPAWSTQ
jgi:DNA invertase Pin-like site-specific DNA recombinase